MVFLDNKIGFYTIDVAYLKTLHEADAEVHYDNHYENKPFIGVVVSQNKHNYFVPLTSAKPKHLNWPNLSKGHCLIYEIADKNNVRDSWVYKDIGAGKVKHILAALEMKKMIPVPDGVFVRVDFNAIPDASYKRLLQKEYSFILKLKDKIIANLTETYNHQKATGTLRKYHCNYSVLEKVCDKYPALSVDTIIDKAADRSEQTGTPGKAKTKNEYTLV